MIIRAKRDKANPYFQMRRATAQDTHLSARALGVMAYLLSKPDDWEPTIDDICRRFSDVGRDQAYKIICEFIDLRYARRTNHRTDGKFTRWLVELHEAPLPENQEMDAPFPDLPDTVNQEMVAPLPENQEVNEQQPTQQDTDAISKKPNVSPFPDLPDTVNQELHDKRKYKLQNKEKRDKRQTADADAPASSTPEVGKSSDADSFTIWDQGVKLLTGGGESKSNARSFLGLQVKNYGKEKVAQAIVSALAQNPVEPKAYIVAVLKGEEKKGNGGSKYDQDRKRRAERDRELFRANRERKTKHSER